GVVHRDVTPENVMLCRQPDAPTEEVVKVLDFGIAKVLDARPEAPLPLEAPTGIRSVLTRVGTVVGTPAYMSPEQGTAQAVDHRSDVYSAGVVLYEMVCGRPPFEGETPLQIVARHVQEAPRPPSAHAPVHPRLETLILNMLAKNPAARPATARTVAEELRRLMPELSSVAGVSGAPIERWLNRTQRKPALDGPARPRVAATTMRSSSSATPAQRPDALPASGRASGPSSGAPISQQPLSAPVSQAPAPPSAEVAALRAMKQTLPLKQKPLLAQQHADALKTLPMDRRSSQNGPPVAPLQPAIAPAQQALAQQAPAISGPPSAPLSAPASAAASVDNRLQARVDSLARTQRVLMVLVVVAFSVIAALVVALLVKGKGR
ncbi:MAG: protein kinase, partial [Polyangiaceae bacterium]|nr:protein kinase [Polyangiaceae bacterium]